MGKEINNVNQNNDTGAQSPMDYVVPRLEGLMDILTDLGIQSFLRLSDEEIPYLEGELEDGSTIFFSYIPVDVTGKFILELARLVEDDGIDTQSALLDVDAFNMGSEFGFAVMDIQSDEIILRAQVPEMDGMRAEWYSFILELFEDSYNELKEMLLAEDSEEE